MYKLSVAFDIVYMCPLCRKLLVTPMRVSATEVDCKSVPFNISPARVDFRVD